MSLVLVSRRSSRAASRIVLESRVCYISDPEHCDHETKTIHPAKNYNTPHDDQSPQVFSDAVMECQAEYLRGREGKRGKRSKRLFEEVIYSSQPCANLTENERAYIEEKILARFCKMVVCRTAWHVDRDTGRADFHILLAAKNQDWPPRLTLWAELSGTGKDHIYGWMNKVDEEIVQELNRAPQRKNAPLKSARTRHLENTKANIGKQVSLADELATYFRVKKIAPENVNSDALEKAIKDLGHVVKRTTERSISVVFRGRQKPRRYNLEDLIGGIPEAMERLQRVPKRTPPKMPGMSFL